MSETSGGAGYDPRRSWQGTETARQAWDAHRTVMCYLGKHESCVHYQLCECDCHRGVEPDTLMHYGSMGTGGAICGERSSVGRSITSTAVVEWVTCDVCRRMQAERARIREG